MAFGIVSSQGTTVINGGSSIAYLAVPTLTTDTFVYNASTTIDITEYLEDYDPKFMTIGGDTTAQVAGEYTVTFDLKTPATQHWGDDSITVKSLTYTITKQPVSVPAVTNTTKTYNTNSQSPTIATYNTNVIGVSGNTGTNAGDYTVTFTLKDTANYEWASGSKTIAAWKINKANGSVSLNPATLTLTASNKTKTSAITRAGDGKITASSNSVATATCSVSNTTLSVTGVDNGTATITVNVAEGTNYLATSTTLTAKCELPSKTLNSNSWAIISEVAQAGQGDAYWDVGDAKQITLNGTIGGSRTGSTTFTSQSLCVFILDFNHKMNGTADNNIIFGGFKTALSGGKDVALMSYKINSDNTTSNGWKGCDARYEALGNGTAKNTDAVASNLTSPVANTVMAAIPSDMRAVVRLWSRWLDNTGGYTGGGANENSADKVTEVKDVCSLLTEHEVFGTRTYANTGEAQYTSRMKYYDSGNSAVRYNATSTDSTVAWWESSPAGTDYYDDDYYGFCGVRASGAAGYGYVYNTRGLAPAWKI